MKAYLSEIFSSIQGEGPYVGERHLFLRFCGCHRHCIFCDTGVDKTPSVTVETVPGSAVFDQIENPLSIEQVMKIVRLMAPNKRFNRISITGGEPLLHFPFLLELLPNLSRDGYSIYLETTGDLPDELKSIIEWIDVVAMDMKLSSVRQEQNTFLAHGSFLKICRDRNIEVFVKLVLSAETDEAELMRGIKEIKNAGGEETLVILQPMSSSQKTDSVPSGAQLLRWQERVAEELLHVRVIPQTHLKMKML